MLPARRQPSRKGENMLWSFLQQNETEMKMKTRETRQNEKERKTIFNTTQTPMFKQHIHTTQTPRYLQG